MALAAGALVLPVALLLILNSTENPEFARPDITDQQFLEQLIANGTPMQDAEGASARVIEREKAAYRIIQDNPEIAVAIAKDGPEAAFQLLEERTRNNQGGVLQEWLNFSDFTYESHTHLALKALREAAKIDPDHHATWMGLSELEEHQFGDIDAAMDAALNAERTATTLRDRLAGLERIAILEVEADNMASANIRFEQIVELNRQQIAAEPENPIWLQELSIALDGLGTTQMFLGDLEAARSTFTEVLELDRMRSKSDPTDWDNLRDIAISSYNLGQLEFQAGNLQLAVSALEEALSINRRNLLERPDSLMMKNDIVRSLSKLSEVNLALGHADAANELALEAEQITRLGLAKNPDALFLHERLLDSLKNSAKAHLALGNIDEALRQFEGALQTGEILSRNGTLTARMQPGLEEVLQGLMTLSDEKSYEEQRDRLAKLGTAITR